MDSGRDDAKPSILAAARHTHHRGAQYAMMECVTRLEFINHGAVGIVGRRHMLNGMMHIRIEFLTLRFDSMNPLFREHIPELLPNQLEPLAVLLISGIVVSRERSIESVEHGKKLLDKMLDAPVPGLVALFLDSLPVVVEICLQANQRVR